MSKTIARFRFAQSRHHAPGLQADNSSRRTSDLAPGSTVESRPVIRAAIADGRRWAAIGLFRLASRSLRCARWLHRQRRISHRSLLVLLSGTRLLERLGAWLGVGHRRKHNQVGQDST